MLLLITRKQQLQISNPNVIQNIGYINSDYIGKEIQLFSTTNSTLPSFKEYSDITLNIKRSFEEQSNIEEYVVMMGHKALGYYKHRSQLLSCILHTRTALFINYHINEVLPLDTLIIESDRQVNR